MASYISSNANRFYTQIEGSYGTVGTITAANRIPAVKLAVKQELDTADRKDKTGTRTFAGLPSGGRRKTSFDLTTYLTNWDKTSVSAPSYAPMFRAALGGTPLTYAGGTAGSGSSGSTLVFSSAHGLTSGQAVTCAGELRFVSAIASTTSVVLNAPFTTTPVAGAILGTTVTIGPATEMPSASIFDYWSPATALQRVLCGVGVGQMELTANGDYHQVTFSGTAQELIDSGSFSGDIGGLSAFPAEPTVESYSYSIVPGHMGQAWLGTVSSRFLTVTSATITLDNDLDLRLREFGSRVPKALLPGQRKVTAAFELFSKDDDATKALYVAAKQQSPIEVMFQLGEVEGQLLGVYLKSVIPEVPEFDDSDNRLQLKFRASRAQGTADDEILVAFA
jgi:hypothetical protein